MLKFRTIKSVKIKYSMFARVVRTMPLFSIKNTEAWLKFTKLHLNNQMTSATMSFGHTIPKWRRLAIIQHHI